jgi:hypothetical protein
VAVALQNFISARGGILGSLGKTIKTHHGRKVLSANDYLP